MAKTAFKPRADNHENTPVLVVSRPSRIRATHAATPSAEGDRSHRRRCSSYSPTTLDSAGGV